MGWTARAACRAAALGGLSFLFACGGSGGSSDDASSWVAVPENPAFLAYLADLEAGRPVPEVIPPRHRAEDVAAVRGFVSPAAAPPSVGGLCAFPARFDLRDVNRVTPAREIACGSCWTAAVMGSLESFFAPAETLDLSEPQLQLRHGADDATCHESGSYYQAVSSFAAWRGPVDEADFDPALPPPDSGPGAPPVRKHVQNVFELPDRTGPFDNCWIKLAVAHLGGVYSGLSWTPFGPQFYENHAYYHPTASQAHAVTIVGWDDGFDRNLFFCGDPSVPESQRVPATDGAFIVKDNGGPDWMEQGFFYVSYHDASIGKTMAVFTGEPVGALGRIHQHDAIGSADGWLALAGSGKETWQGNVFTAPAQEYLAAASFFEGFDAEMDYRIEVHLDPTNGPVNPAGPAATVDVSLLLTGYFTVRLPQPLLLQKGQRFGVVLRGHNRAGGWPGLIPVERPRPGYSQVKAGPGESWLGTDGTTWQDVTTVQVPKAGGGTEVLSGTNLRIKAFTDPVLQASASIDLDDMSIAWEIVNDGTDSAWVQPTARRRVNVGGLFEDVGDEILAPYYAEEMGPVLDTFEGWIFVPPGGRVVALSGPWVVGVGEQVALRLRYIDPVDGITVSEGILKHLNDLLNDPLVVTATDPANGGQVNVPTPVLVVTFDEAAKVGPGILGITITSGWKVMAGFATVNGTQMQIVPAAPLTSTEAGGTTWTVQVPADAAVSQALGNPLKQAYQFSFHAIGVN